MYSNMQNGLKDLDFEHWMAIAHVVLNHDTNGLEACLVLLDSMMESLVKNAEVLQTSIESFVTGSCPFLECPHHGAVVHVATADLGLTLVA